jgi:oligopeptidase B
MANSMGGFLYIASNDANHVNFRIQKAALETVDQRDTWQDVLPSKAHTLLVEFEVYDHYLAAIFMKEASHELHLFPLSDLSNPRRISLSDDPCEMSLIFEEPGLPYLRFKHSTLTSPPAQYEYFFETGEIKKVHQLPIPNYAPENYRIERMTAKTWDGKDLPLTLLRSASADPKQSPLCIYAYGSYGLSMEPTFAKSCLSIVDAGFTFALVHARGGCERGYEWYLDGKLDTKINTFKDVISGTEALIQRFDIRSPGKVVLNGGSAGGLVVGYCANNRPDLFGTVIGEVPFVDLTKDMLDASLPLTPQEWREWGNPEDGQVFDYFMQYDPIMNVHKGVYPDVLVTAGLTDPRVPYWEPYKFAELVRSERTNKGLTLCYTYDSGGHFGGSGRYENFKKTARKIAFAKKAVDTWDERRVEEQTTQEG